MAQQGELFPKAEVTIRLGSSRGEPRLWVRRIVLWEKPGEIIREIRLRRGLNIIWSPDPGAMQAELGLDAGSGHGAGKTLFCRLLRYCLGEDTFSNDGQRRSIVELLPAGLVGVEVVIDGKLWSGIRPIGQTRKHLAREGATLEELAPMKEPGGSFEILLDALRSQIFPDGIDSYLPSERQNAAFLSVLSTLQLPPSPRKGKMNQTSSDDDVKVFPEAGIVQRERSLPLMIDRETRGITLEQRRLFYAEELRAVANLKSPLLIEALAAVPREAFLGHPPWLFSSQAPSKDGAYRTTSDVRELYHDVMVALRPALRLNNGQPSLIAGCLDRLNLASGKDVLHVGCGTGYYTAIMASMVGPTGSVLAVEIDPELAGKAAANLCSCRNVAIENRDGTDFQPFTSRCEDGMPKPPARFDAIFVNAAVTQPSPCWLSSLRDGGAIMVPLAAGETLTCPKAVLILIEKRGDRFQADLHSVFTIYQSPSFRDHANWAKLSDSLKSRAIGRLRSVRVEPHAEDDHCLVHTPGFCLSSQTVA